MKKINIGGLFSKLKKPASKDFKRPSFVNQLTGFFEWDKIMNNLFSPDKRPKIHKLFILTCICVITYISGKMIALSLLNLLSNDKPKRAHSTMAPIYSNKDGPRKMLATIQNANLFNTPSDSSGPAKVDTPKLKDFAQKKCLEAKRTSSLPIKLLSTTVMQDSVKSVASVQIRSKKTPIGLHEGDMVSGMAEIGKISRLKIIIKNLQSGSCEYIESKVVKLNNSSKGNLNVVSPSRGKQLMANKNMDGIKNTGNHFEISKKKRDELLKDIGSILTQARGIPIKNHDGTMSFKIVEVSPGGLFSHLNIREFDVINTINGKAIKNMAEVMDLFGRIKDIDNLSLGISRDGVDSVQEYKFK